MSLVPLVVATCGVTATALELLCPALVFSVLLCPALFFSALLCPAFFFSALLCPALVFSALVGSWDTSTFFRKLARTGDAGWVSCPALPWSLLSVDGAVIAVLGATVFSSVPAAGSAGGTADAGAADATADGATAVAATAAAAPADVAPGTAAAEWGLTEGAMPFADGGPAWVLLVGAPVSMPSLLPLSPCAAGPLAFLSPAGLTPSGAPAALAAATSLEPAGGGP